MRLKPEATPDGRHVVLDLFPFGVAALRIAAPRVRVAAVTPYPTEAVKTSMLARYNELSDQLSRLNRSPLEGRTGPPNPGFEANQCPDGPVDRGPPRGRARGVGRPARLAGRGQSGQHRRDRLGAVPLGTRQPPPRRPGPPAAVVSDRFVPDVQTSLTIQAWLRSDQPDAKVRVWIEGESAGQPFVRRSELSIQNEWSAMAVRTLDIPPAGLTGARLRFELLSPGRLWVDDLSLAGERSRRPSDQRPEGPGGRLARLPRETVCRLCPAGRLALGAAAGHRRGRRRRWTRLRPTGPGMIRTGGTTALPPDRRLR